MVDDRKETENMGEREKEEKEPPVRMPEGMVIYDPDNPVYEKRHTCFVLAKVAETFHGAEADQEMPDGSYPEEKK